MLQMIKALFEKPVVTDGILLRLIIRRLAHDEIYHLQNMTNRWKIPGKIYTLPGSVVVIELEGSERLLNTKLEELQRYPRLHSRNIEIKRLPYTGQHKFFSIVFV